MKDQRLELWQQQGVKTSQKEVWWEENMQTGVSDEMRITGCPQKAQTLYHRSLGNAS